MHSKLPVVLPYIESHNSSAWAQYTIRVQDRDLVQKKLKAAGIPTAVHYPIPLNKQPAVVDDSVDLTRGDEAAAQVISLPMSPYLVEVDQHAIAKVLKKILI